MTTWVVVLALGAAVVVACAELSCRWWMRRRSRYHVWAPGLRLELHQDPDVFPQCEPRVRVEINRDGERGGDVRGDEAGLLRVLAAGGSAVECLALDQSTSWPGVLERLLNSTSSLAALGARRVHVGNVGRSGVASSHLDLIFEHLLPQYRELGVIVIMVGASDVLQWLEEGAPPALGNSAASVPETFACHPQHPFGWKPGQWAMMELARRLRRVWLRPVEVREQAGSWVPAARKMRAQVNELRTSTADPAVILDSFDHHFRRLLQCAKAHAHRVLVVRQPWFEKEYAAEESARFWHGGVGKAWKQTITVFYAQEVLNHLMGLIDAHAAALADEAGVEHLDLRPVLTPSLDNYYDCFHSTPQGAAVIARAVAAFVLRRPAPAGRARAPAPAGRPSNAVAVG